MTTSDFDKYTNTPEFRALLREYDENPALVCVDDLLDIADYYYGLHDPRAEQAVDMCIEEEPDNDDALLFKARIAIADHDDVKTAERYYKRVADKEHNAEAFMIFGEIALCHGRSDVANKHFEQRYEQLLNTPDEEAPGMEDAIEDDDPEDAEEDITFVIKQLHEDQRFFPLDVAELFCDYEHFAYAQAWLERLDADDYADAHEYHQNWARVHEGCERYDKAIAEWDKALDLYPFSDYSWMRLAPLLYDKQEWKRALDACNYALALNADQPRAMVLKADCLYRLQRDKEVERYLDTLIAKHPKAPFTATLTAAKHIYSGKEELANQDIVHALERLGEMNDAEREETITLSEMWHNTGEDAEEYDDDQLPF